MAYRPLTLRCWQAFLTLHGYKHTRTKGSHYLWTKRGFRPIPVWGDEKEIPPQHLKTGCFTMGYTMDELYSWAATNC